MQSPFEEVKELVRAKRYTDARNLLVSMRNDPKAQKWLQRLDEIMLAKEEMSAAAASESSEVAAASAADEPKKKKLPFGEPRNPLPGGDTPLASIFSTLSFFMPMIILPLWSVYLAFNWKRMGKPEWTTLAVTSSISVLVAMWSCFVLAFAVPRFSGGGLVGYLVLAGVAIWVYGVQYGLQTTAYKKWQEQGGAALYKHKYPVYGAMFRWAAGLILIVGGVFAVSAYQNRPKTFTSAELSLEYDSVWSTIDIKSFPECQSFQSVSLTCVAAFQRSYGSTVVMVFERPNTTNLVLKDVDLAMWEALGQATPLTLQSQWETTLDGAPTRAREFTFTKDGINAYSLSLMLLKDNSFYWIFASSTSKALFEEDRESIQKLYSSMKFTSQPDL